MNATLKSRVNVLQEDVGGNGEYPGDSGEEETDGRVDDDIGHRIAVKVACLLVHPLPEIMQLANHLKNHKICVFNIFLKFFFIVTHF